jgi:flagellar hook-basal body complex protein FliE
MINLNPNISTVPTQISPAADTAGIAKPSAAAKDFSKTVNAVSDFLSQVDEQQKASDVSIMDLMSGRNGDINSVVAAVAKADMSFKVLVGVRNKLIEAYKQTMNMPI